MDNDQSLEERLNALAGGSEQPEPSDGDDGQSAHVEESVMDNPAVIQHITRFHCDGQEMLSGQFRMSFSPQQTSAVLHVPLHPPMGSVPQVESFCDNEDFRIRVTDAQRFGVRLEIKTPPMDAEVSGVIHVEIKAS